MIERKRQVLTIIENGHISGSPGDIYIIIEICRDSGRRIYKQEQHNTTERSTEDIHGRPTGLDPKALNFFYLTFSFGSKKSKEQKE